MKHRTMVLLIAILLCAALVAPGYAQESMEKRGQAGMTFLLINPWPRAAALGGASNGIDGEVGALFQNPAGIARMPGQADLMFARTQWIADIAQNAFAAAFRVQNIGIFGLTWISMDHGDIYKTVIVPDPTTVGYKDMGTVETSESAIGLAYARVITDRFAVGGQIKRVAQNLEDNESSGFAADFGLIYYTGFRGTRVTMSVRNFSREVQILKESVQMPLIFRMGLGLDAFQLLAPGMSQMGSLMLLAEATHPRDSPEKMDIGAEFWFQDMLAVRVGTGINYDENNVAGGVGLKYAYGTTQVRADFSYTPYGDPLDAVSRFSVSLSL